MESARPHWRYIDVRGNQHVRCLLVQHVFTFQSSCSALSARSIFPVQRTRIGSERVISVGSVITNSMGAPAVISVSRYMNTPRELTSRVCPANSRLPLSRNFTEIGKSSENLRVFLFSG